MESIKQVSAEKENEMNEMMEDAGQISGRCREHPYYRRRHCPECKKAAQSSMVELAEMVGERSVFFNRKKVIGEVEWRRL